MSIAKHATAAVLVFIAISSLAIWISEVGGAGNLYRVVLYDANGGVIREWNDARMRNRKGNECRFTDTEGRAVRISGTFVVEQVVLNTKEE